MQHLHSLWISWRRDEQWAIVLSLLALSLFGGITYARWRSATPLPPLFKEARANQSKLTATASVQHLPSKQSPAPKTIMVHVVGAVRRPGLLVLPASSRVIDAIRQAGGATGEGDVNAINLAAALKDGQQVNLPVRIAARAATAVEPAKIPEPVRAAKRAKSPAGPINVNTASAEALEALPGVGPAIAARIVAFRQKNGRFESIEDLDKVSGIGEKKLEMMRGFVVF